MNAVSSLDPRQHRDKPLRQRHHLRSGVWAIPPPCPTSTVQSFSSPATPTPTPPQRKRWVTLTLGSRALHHRLHGLHYRPQTVTFAGLTRNPAATVTFQGARPATWGPNNQAGSAAVSRWGLALCPAIGGPSNAVDFATQTGAAPSITRFAGYSASATIERRRAARLVPRRPRRREGNLTASLSLAAVLVLGNNLTLSGNVRHPHPYR